MRVDGAQHQQGQPELLRGEHDGALGLDAAVMPVVRPALTGGALAPIKPAHGARTRECVGCARARCKRAGEGGGRAGSEVSGGGVGSGSGVMRGWVGRRVEWGERRGRWVALRRGKTHQHVDDVDCPEPAFHRPLTW